MESTVDFAPSPPWRIPTSSKLPAVRPQASTSHLLPDRTHVSPFHYPGTHSPPHCLRRPGPSECSLELPVSYQNLTMGWSFRMQLDALDKFEDEDEWEEPGSLATDHPGESSKIRDSVVSVIPSTLRIPLSSRSPPSLSVKHRSQRLDVIQNIHHGSESTDEPSSDTDTTQFSVETDPNLDRRRKVHSLLRYQDSNKFSLDETSYPDSPSNRHSSCRPSKISIPDILNPAPGSGQRHTPILGSKINLSDSDAKSSFLIPARNSPGHKQQLWTTSYYRRDSHLCREE
ncbi:hypothetical protein GYMLUDRAFT_67363 [Collybiopsis luxurians FD-317 M1]|nr:hypothetical protein GYMLUDRAFT_67363 [Collybiopsis luxurians FD-317 M1]